ncbi:MAG TPA: DUF6064 family protein [Gemmatimonadales bacterium]|nr:DUF6064 family protein [Gemmatimonadales bacterium]
MLPFGRQEFLEVFGRYNIAVWPAQLLLYAVALVIVALILRRERRSVVVALLATLWLWTGVVYHLLFFSEINPAARYFGIAFIAQAVLLLATDRRQTASGEWGTPIARSTGKVLIAYALVGYPLIGSLAGQTYPTVVTLGLPCPTTIFTIGVLLIALRQPSVWLLAIPILWAIIGTFAAIALSIPQDYGLTVAGLGAAVRLLTRQSQDKAGWIETSQANV